MASTTCQQSLEIVRCFSFEKRRSSHILSMCHSDRLKSFGAREQERAPRYFSPALETVYPVLNFSDYLHFRVPEVGLATLFDMFGPSLQVT